jgi:FAD/FMN-containing dehydrogenase
VTHRPDELDRRTDADIAAMRTVKAAFDPSGYLNPAVLFG